MERITASPTKLRDGSWGLRVPAGTEPGTVVQVTTRSGKSWLARTGKVLWEGDGVALCVEDDGFQQEAEDTTAGLARSGRVWQATPAKLRDGTWGCRVAGTPSPGDEVTIVARSGKSWMTRIERVVWQGDDVALCTTARASRSLGGDSHGMCESCGEHRAVTTATDGSGIVGRVCRTCAADPMSVSFG